MDKKIFTGLLVSFVFCGVVIASEQPDSPMTQLMKQRKTLNPTGLVRSALQRTKVLESVIAEKDAEIAMLKEKIAELEKIIKEQVEEINILNLLFSDIQNILIRK